MRRRPPKQGELRTDVSKATMFQGNRKVSKGFNWFVQSCCLGALIRGLQNLGASCKRDVFTFFLRRAKRTKKHARTCKKLPVASFCASETAETGRIANGREQGDHVSRRLRFANLWTPGTIQIAGRYVISAETTSHHQVTGFAKSCNFAGYRRQ